jgi:hypothetical protein
MSFFVEIGRLWRRHVVENTVSVFHKFLEKISTKMSYSWIFKVVFDLELE